MLLLDYSSTSVTLRERGHGIVGIAAMQSELVPVLGWLVRVFGRLDPVLCVGQGEGGFVRRARPGLPSAGLFRRRLPR